MKCVNCSWRQDDLCTAHAEAKGTLERDFPPHPFSGCVIPVVDGYLAQIGPGHRVLEIGCGSWSRIKDHCDKVGATYDAIDVIESYYGKPTVATRIENVAALSFPDETFDFVIGNQTLEHWGEFGCRTEFGLQQCFRVTKDGGKVMMNVPIHFHGVGEFLMGDYGWIERTFADFSGAVTLERWGEEAAPLTPYLAHPTYTPLRAAPAYVLDIQAVKNRPTPNHHRNGFAPSGRLAQVLANPPSYVLHQLLIRIGLKRPR